MLYMPFCDVTLTVTVTVTVTVTAQDFLAENSHSLSISDSSTSLMPRASYTCPEDRGETNETNATDPCVGYAVDVEALQDHPGITWLSCRSPALGDWFVSA